MKKALINYIQNEKNDELYTPLEAIKPLWKYIKNYIEKTETIPEDITIWEPTDFGESKITSFFKELGFNVISTHKNNFDFLKDKADFNFDFIITNPPYTLKNEFLKKCYEYDRPFALLLPLTTLEGVERGKIFKEHDVRLIILNKRINFLNQKKSNWFNTSWFCYGLLTNYLNFEEVE